MTTSETTGATGTPVGRAGLLTRYPVKSMQGEDLDAAEIGPGGLAGDRRLALVDGATGKVASAKYPRLWRSLLQLRARVELDAVVITLPDGSTLRSDADDVDAVLGGLLDREVTLSRTRPDGAVLDRAVPEEVFEQGETGEVAFELLELGQASPAATFVDYAPVHLVTTASLDAVAAAAGHEVAALRYRPNLVVETPEDVTGFVENDWVGREVAVGDEVVLRIVLPTPRCAVPTLAHGALPADLAAVRAVAEHNRIPVEGFGLQPSAGVYGEVLRPGRVALGDEIRLL